MKTTVKASQVPAHEYANRRSSLIVRSASTPRRVDSTRISITSAVCK